MKETINTEDWIVERCSKPFESQEDAAIYMKEKKFDAKLVHTHTFDMIDLPIALKYARERIDDAIKIVIKPHNV